MNRAVEIVQARQKQCCLQCKVSSSPFLTALHKLELMHMHHASTLAQCSLVAIIATTYPLVFYRLLYTSRHHCSPDRDASRVWSGTSVRTISKQRDVARYRRRLKKHWAIAASDTMTLGTAASQTMACFAKRRCRTVVECASQCTTRHRPCA